MKYGFSNPDEAGDYFFARPMPTWGGDLSGIDFDNIYYYIKLEYAIEMNRLVQIQMEGSVG